MPVVLDDHGLGHGLRLNAGLLDEDGDVDAELHDQAQYGRPNHGCQDGKVEDVDCLFFAVWRQGVKTRLLVEVFAIVLSAIRMKGLSSDSTHVQSKPDRPQEMCYKKLIQRS